MANGVEWRFWTADIEPRVDCTRKALCRTFTVTQSAFSFTHSPPFIQQCVTAAMLSAVYPNGSSWGSVSCPRTLQVPRFEAATLGLLVHGLFYQQRRDQWPMTPWLQCWRAAVKSKCRRSSKMQWPLSGWKLWESLCSFNGIFKIVFWWNHH